MWLEPDQAVIRTVLERQAREHPQRPVVTFESGETWSSLDGLDAAYRAANVLAELGVRQDDRVTIILPNGPELLRAWWGTRCLGAAIHPVNPVLKGRLLRRPLEIAEPRVVVTSPELAAAYAEELTGFRIVTPDALLAGAPTPPPLARAIDLADPEVILMTSGTTGLSKLWSSPVAQTSTTGAYVRDAGLGPDDRFLIELPLFHTAGLGVTSGCLRAGTHVFLRTKPSLTNLLRLAAEHEITAAFLIGSMAAKLMQAEPSPLDRAHPLKVLVAAPLPADLPGFMERFGVRHIVTSYGSTETGGPIGMGGNGELPSRGSSGKERPGWGDYRLVDASGADVEAGTPGELLLRPAHPAALKGHYLKDPETTAQAWADGWFHTGDLFRRDANGEYYFVERNRDSLRRRGENISSFEVEREVLLEDGVQAVACVGVESPDDAGLEVKVWIVPSPGASPDLGAIAANLASRLPAFMVPRFYELTDELPMTPTQRVQKYLLRERGNGPDAWDRLAGTRQGQPATST